MRVLDRSERSPGDKNGVGGSLGAIDGPENGVGGSLGAIDGPEIGVGGSLGAIVGRENRLRGSLGAIARGDARDAAMAATTLARWPRSPRRAMDFYIGVDRDAKRAAELRRAACLTSPDVFLEQPVPCSRSL